MNVGIKKVLYATDLSPNSAFAFQYATDYAEKHDAQIVILHVFEDLRQVDTAFKHYFTREQREAMSRDKTQTVEQIKQRLGTFCENVRKDDPSCVFRVDQIEVCEGYPANMILDKAEEFDCDVIFMGTHGMKGIQFLTGSRALKVVTNSKTPFVISQDRLPKDDNIDSIVMPVDLGTEDKQVLTMVIRAAKTFNAKVHLFVAKRKDEFHENAVNRNVSFAKRYLSEHDVEYTTTRANSPDDFDAQLIRFSDSIDADIIAIINHREDGYKNLFGSNFDQNIITNKAKIPVMVMNAKDNTDVNDIFGVFS
jgi:nucleotide-binding universal stress UspA family protein